MRYLSNVFLDRLRIRGPQKSTTCLYRELELTKPLRGDRFFDVMDPLCRSRQCAYHLFGLSYDLARGLGIVASQIQSGQSLGVFDYQFVNSGIVLVLVLRFLEPAFEKLVDGHIAVFSTAALGAGLRTIKLV